MEKIIFEQCGASDWIEKTDYRICKYCGTKYSKQKTYSNEGISVLDDVERLLEKCRRNPYKAKKYAQLVLDIDPTNEEAKKYI